ncbi:diguanylate cyclase domain-containing protein [Agrobacterium tumefaciens]|uniref:diguanylate cyclase domain-containing protein n=1 Tax=Agrobacterium tumefaciens TaxID=358 RepID=UPI002200580E|nr:diguanylate cyclase [Agrobacterium tumefaciens]
MRGLNRTEHGSTDTLRLRSSLWRRRVSCCDVGTANDRIDHLRRVFEAKTFTSEKLHVTFSAGIAEYRHGSRKELLIRADNALYDAKNSGRNSTKLA